MNHFYTALLGILFINSIYLLGKFTTAIWLGVHEDHLFLGFGKHPAITFRIKNLKISLGLFIPLPWLSKFYKFKDGIKERIRYEWEFFEQPVYKRLIVTYGGFLSMIIASIVILSILEYRKTDAYISSEELNKYGIYPSAFAREKGFRKGDKIVSINGNNYKGLRDLYSVDVLLGDSLYYEVMRGQDSLIINMGANFIDEIVINTEQPLFTPNAPFKISDIISGSPAETAGLKQNDIVLEVDGVSISSMQEFSEIAMQHAGDSIPIVVKRNEKIISLKTGVNSEGKIGFFSAPLIKPTYVRKTPLGAVQSGFNTAYKILIYNLIGIQRTEVQKALRLSGPIDVSSVFPGELTSFFKVSAILLLLGSFYEILPFPKSSFLRCIPLLMESVFNKRLSSRAFTNIQRWAWFPLILMIMWSVINDLLKFL